MDVSQIDHTQKTSLRIRPLAQALGCPGTRFHRWPHSVQGAGQNRLDF